MCGRFIFITWNIDKNGNYDGTLRLQFIRFINNITKGNGRFIGF